MPFPSNSDAVAQDQIRAFVERIMRMREEARAINDDIREIYAEAKGNGFDKTVLGKVVLHVERRSTKAAEMLEAAALFDLYLEAIDGTGTRIALTHTHETDHSSEVRNMVTNPVTPGGPAAEGAEPPSPQQASSADTNSEIPSTEDVSPEPLSLDEAVIGANAGGVDEEAVTQSQLQTEPVAEERVVAGEPGLNDDDSGRADALGALGSDVEVVAPRPTAADNARSIRPWCLNADDLSKCAGQGRKHCHGCLKAHADAEGMSA